MTKKDQVAKIIRVISVPPVMVSVMVLILGKANPEVFEDPLQIVVTIMLLGVVPILAYPLQQLIPSLRDKGREGQRNLAFVLNFIGYGVAFVWALAMQVSMQLKLICSTYFLSVLLLTICNKCFHFRASGHACSFTGPLVLLVYLVGVKMLIPCLVVAGMIIWASLYLKRHTARELSGGILVCCISFVLSLIGVS